MIIGLTGPTGAGKTTALMCLKQMGFAVLDCDAVYHKLLSESHELIAELADAFPAAVSDGAVDRKRLAAIVFSDNDQLLKLNTISHRAVKNEVLRLISKLPPGTDAAIDAVELISGGLAEICDVTVAVLAPIERRAERIMMRDCVSRERAMMRIHAQKPDEYYEQNCDHCIVNDFDTEDQFNKLCAVFFGVLRRKIYE